MILGLLNEKKSIFPIFLLRLSSNASYWKASTTHSLWPSGMSTFFKVSLNSCLWLSSMLPWLFALWFLIYTWGGNESLAASCIICFCFLIGLELREELVFKKFIEFEVPGESEIIHGAHLLKNTQVWSMHIQSKLRENQNKEWVSYSLDSDFRE